MTLSISSVLQRQRSHIISSNASTGQVAVSKRGQATARMVQAQGIGKHAGVL